MCRRPATACACLADAPGAAARSAASAARAARGPGPAATEWNPSGQAPLEYRGDSTGEAHFGDYVPDMPQLARLQTPVDNQYLHNFLERGGQRYEQTLAPEYYEQVSEELAAIEAFAAIPTLDESMVVRRSEQYKALPVVDRPARAVDIGTQLSQKTWGDFAAAHERARVLMQLKQKAERVAQAMGLDVVRKLVNQVAQDPLLLAPVREAVVALEPSLLAPGHGQPALFQRRRPPGAPPGGVRGTAQLPIQRRVRQRVRRVLRSGAAGVQCVERTGDRGPAGFCDCAGRTAAGMGDPGPATTRPPRAATCRRSATPKRARRWPTRWPGT